MERNCFYGFMSTFLSKCLATQAPLVHILRPHSVSFSNSNFFPCLIQHEFSCNDGDRVFLYLVGRPINLHLRHVLSFWDGGLRSFFFVCLFFGKHHHFSLSSTLALRVATCPCVPTVESNQFVYFHTQGADSCQGLNLKAHLDSFCPNVALCAPTDSAPVHL